MRGQRAVLAGVFATGVGALALWGTHRRYLVATVDGPSMEPTLHRGDRLLVRRAARARAGQIVVVRVPNPPLFDGLPPELAELTPDALATIPERLDLAPAPTGRLMIKRAVAVAGDRVPRSASPPCARSPSTWSPRARWSSWATTRAPAGTRARTGSCTDTSWWASPSAGSSRPATPRLPRAKGWCERPRSTRMGSTWDTGGSPGTRR